MGCTVKICRLTPSLLLLLFFYGFQLDTFKMATDITTCKECEEAALRGMSPPLEQIAVSDGPIFLYRCRACGGLWEENLRESHPITKEAAKERFHLESL